MDHSIIRVVYSRYRLRIFIGHSSQNRNDLDQKDPDMVSNALKMAQFSSRETIAHHKNTMARTPLTIFARPFVLVSAR
jgi:hypothetical protein